MANCKIQEYRVSLLNAVRDNSELTLQSIKFLAGTGALRQNKGFCHDVNRLICTLESAFVKD